MTAAGRGARRGGAGVGVRVERVSLVLDGRTVLRAIDADLPPGSRWLLLGANGAGKTQFLKLLAGERWPTPTGRERRTWVDAAGRAVDLVELLPRIAFVGGERQDRYERRAWDFTVQAVVGSGCLGVDRPLRPLAPGERARVRTELRRFGLWALRRRRLLSLSYGQRRLALLARALASRPRLLLLDEPYNGLDADARATLDRALTALARTRLTIVLSAHRADDAPRAFDRALVLERGRLAYAGGRDGAPHAWLAPTPARVAPAPTRVARPTVPEPLVRMHGVDLYRDYRPVLRGVDWTIGAGEHWAIVGDNGSGKSTLLQFLHGALPAALGGRVERRGHPPGTHLEDWRRRASLVSPELQAGYRADVTVEELVVSGLRSSIGLDAPPSPPERRRARVALRRTGLASLASRPFRTLSYGQRRLALLARALAPGPELLLLDEPLTGLDATWRVRVAALLERLAGEGTQLVMAVHHAGDLVPSIRRALRLADGAARVVRVPARVGRTVC